MNIKYGDTHCSRIFLLASSRFLTIKTRGVLFDTLLQNNPRSEKVKAEKWTRKCDDVRNAWRTKNSKMTTHQSAHFSSDNFSFNLAKIHKRGANRGAVYSIVQPTVLLQKAEIHPLKKHFLLKWKIAAWQNSRKVNLISAWIAWIKMIGEHRGQMTYYYARAAFASIKNFCFTDGKAENCSIFVPGGQGWQMTYSFVSLSKKPSWGLLDMCHAWAKKIINSFGFSHYIWRIWIVLINLSVFIHRFYITINSFMHIIVSYVG